MDDSMGAGLMAVVAVSGSIVFLSLQLHKRLLSDFMEKIEFELGSGKDGRKKRVKFDDTETRFDEMKMKKTASCSNRCVGSKVIMNDNNKHGEKKQQGGSAMPGNRQAMYKGILQYRKLSSPCI